MIYSSIKRIGAGLLMLLASVNLASAACEQVRFSDVGWTEPMQQAPLFC